MCLPHFVESYPNSSFFFVLRVYNMYRKKKKKREPKFDAFKYLDNKKKRPAGLRQIIDILEKGGEKKELRVIRYMYDNFIDNFFQSDASWKRTLRQKNYFTPTAFFVMLDIDKDDEDDEEKYDQNVFDYITHYIESTDVLPYPMWQVFIIAQIDYMDKIVFTIRNIWMQLLNRRPPEIKKFFQILFMERGLIWIPDVFYITFVRMITKNQTIAPFLTPLIWNLFNSISWRLHHANNISAVFLTNVIWISKSLEKPLPKLFMNMMRFLTKTKKVKLLRDMLIISSMRKLAYTDELLEVLLGNAYLTQSLRRYVRLVGDANLRMRFDNLAKTTVVTLPEDDIHEYAPNRRDSIEL